MFEKCFFESAHKFLEISLDVTSAITKESPKAVRIYIESHWVLYKES
jgi:hypothetical protein